jgi:hypothetical protein
MSIWDMTKNVMLTKLVLIIMGMIFFSFGNTLLWIILSVIMLLVGAYISIRGGMGAGHEAASVSASIREISERNGNLNGIDAKLFKKAWSKQTGLMTIFSGALFDYIVCCTYIIVMLLGGEGVLLFVSRVACWLCIVPYWPILVYSHPVFDVLTWDIAALLMIAPFLFPALQYIGYRQRPKLWKKTEEAMRQGKRRAKARSRIVRKQKVYKAKGPLI